MAGIDNHPQLPRIVELVRQGYAAQDQDQLYAALSPLFEDVFCGGGSAGPDDGAVDQLATVVGALEDVDSVDGLFLRECAHEDGAVYDLSYLKSYALDDLPSSL